MIARGRLARVLFVFAWLVVGGEETEVRLLAKHLDRDRFSIEVAACFRNPSMPEQTHDQLRALGVALDTTPYALSDEEKIDYLARKLAEFDLVVACQAPVDIYPALRRLTTPPPLIEHGGLVAEARALPKDLTARYVGVCRSIRDAAAAAMPDRPWHAIEIPSMVDLGEFDPADRPAVRRELGVEAGAPLIGWVGRLDRKKRVEDFLHAAATVRAEHPPARFLVVGGPDAFMPEYTEELRGLARRLGLEPGLRFLGDRPDVPRLLSALDVFVWLSRGEGMPHVIAEAGAARLPVVATRDNGSTQQIEDGVSGLFVPHGQPAAAAAAIDRLIRDRPLARRLGLALRRAVERRYSAGAVVPRWEALFEEVIAERRAGAVAAPTIRHRVAPSGRPPQAGGSLAGNDSSDARSMS